MALSAEKISKNYQKHLKIVDTYIGDRKESILSMLNHMEDTYVMAPASGKTWYHNAFPGGYVDHVNRVVEFAVKQSRLYEEMGGSIDFTEEELVFAALFHDLGKIGDGDSPNYIPQTDKWRQDKLSEMYTFNPDLDFMLIPDRSLFILQKFGIKVSQKEFLAIRCHDAAWLTCILLTVIERSYVVFRFQPAKATINAINPVIICFSIISPHIILTATTTTITTETTIAITNKIV